MSYTIAFQMDPLNIINVDADSSFILGLEAQKRGYKLFHYLPDNINFKNGHLSVTGQFFELRREKGNHFTAGEMQTIDMKSLDLILMRQDPPFDMSYITATHFLDLLSSDVLVLNNPYEVRNAPEKIWCLEYPDLMPPTLVSNNRDEIKAFRKEYKDIIIKPLYGNGGARIFKIMENDGNMNVVLELFDDLYREPVMVQKYLPEIVQGDKRILIFDGEPVGAVNRVPASDEARANFHAGGTAQKTDLTNRDLEVCERLKPELKKRNLVFTGIDMIGNYLTEINITSPTGIQEINRLNGTALESDLWDIFEDKLKAFRS